MAAPTVAVSIRLSAMDGTPYAFTEVTAKLDRNDVYEGFVISDPVTGTTNAAGLVTLNLFPNNPTTGLGTTGSVYTFTAKPAGGRSWRVTAQIPNSACDLEDVVDLSAVEGVGEAEAAQATAQAAAVAAAASATTAAGSATAAAASAVTAGTHATNAGTSATAAAGSATAAAASATAASTSQTSAAASATAAEASRDAIDNRIYPGTYSVAPTVRPDGSAREAGDVYFNSTANLSYRWNASSWVASDINTANLAATTGASLIGTTRGGSLDVVLSPLSILGGGSTSHSDGTDTITGSARWFLGNAVASSDDSALLIGRSLTGSYVSGAHAVRDESTYTSSGTGLHAYASFDSVITLAGTVAYNHLHNFQARSIYNGSGLMNQMSAFTNDPQVNGPVNALRGLHVNNATGSGTVTEQSGVWINDLTKGTSNYGVKLNLTSGASKYSIHTGTAESYFGGQITASAGQSWAGAIAIPSANQRLNFAAGTNIVLSGGGTIAQISSMNDAANAYQPLFLQGSVAVINTGAVAAEAARFDASRNLLIGVTAGGSGGAQTICLETDTAPSDTPADTVSFYSSDHSAGHTIPSFRCEGTNVHLTGAPDVVATSRVRIRVNGNIVSLLAE